MTPLDRDLLIRTIASEAGGEGDEGMAAVAHVIRNRLNTGRWGKTYGDVVFSRSQFEPWGRGGRSNDPFEIEPTDPKYLAASSVVERMLAGKLPDPSKGATHFMNTAVVRERNGGTLGRAGSWAKNQTAQIGGHTFYAPDGPAKPAPAQTAIAPAIRPESLNQAPKLPDPPAVSRPVVEQKPAAPGILPAAPPASTVAAPKALGQSDIPLFGSEAPPERRAPSQPVLSTLLDAPMGTAPKAAAPVEPAPPTDTTINTHEESANSYFSRISPEQRGPNPLQQLASLFGVSA